MGLLLLLGLIGYGLMAFYTLIVFARITGRGVGWSLLAGLAWPVTWLLLFWLVTRHD